ncbi:MAG: hypothetical protein GF344_09935 [Chitinivibrionales bacterium]|nr:hypothetical protein [Chitinivibrionales bacterium]MBD3357156.1 hypothetical protein [Chitinivibrionales bacterium]
MIQGKIWRAAAWAVMGAYAGMVVSAHARDGAKILSNDLWALAGGGDYLWMLSAKGLNYTTEAFADTIGWRGTASSGAAEYTGPLVYGKGRVLAGVEPGDDPEDVGDLVVFHADGEREARIDLNYQVDSLRNAISSQRESIIMAWDAARGFGAFWVTMIDGGLAKIRFDRSASEVTLHMPGVEGLFSPSTFTPDALSDALGDPARTPQLVEVDTAEGCLWVLCEKKIWKYKAPDSSSAEGVWTWEAVVDTTTKASAYIGLAVRPRTDSMPGAVFVTVETDDGKTKLYRFDPVEGTWRALELVRSRDVPDQIVFGSGRHVFIRHGGQLALYKDAGSKLEYVVDMMDRIRNENSPSFEATDVLLTRRGEEERLWVATSIGLYYGSTGLYDRDETEPFTVVRRSNPLAGGLEETYAYPSIITATETWVRPADAIFAYNLSEDDHVTIDVFDWNMDHVVRIIDDQHRLAGSKRTRGRSTVEKFDRWDGTFDNRGSKSVAPGVYYYRITTRKGKRAFGKVIVAGN